MRTNRVGTALAWIALGVACAAPGTPPPERPPARPAELALAPPPEHAAAPPPVASEPAPVPASPDPSPEAAPAQVAPAKPVSAGSASEYAAALKRARSARDRLRAKRAPPTGGRLDRARALAHTNGPLKKWVTDARAVLDEAGKHYSDAGRVAPAPAQRMRALAEWSELQLLYTDRFHQAAMAAMPRDFDKSPEIAQTYGDALYDAMQPTYDAALEGLAECARSKDAEPSVAQRCAALVQKPFNVEKGAKLTRASAQQVLRRARRAMRECYERALADDPDLEGDLVLRLTIDRTGSVSSIRSDAAGLPSPAAVSCLETSVRTLKFPPSPGKPFSVDFPVSFRR